MDYLSQLPTNDPLVRNAVLKLKNGLLTAVKNVILLRERWNPDWHFYPRINVHKTSSFQALPEDQKKIVWDLYLHYYYKRQEDLWGKIGGSRLPVICGATDMLVCGEDLGMVPDCVPPVMKDLSILGLSVQRMPPDPMQLFQHPSDNSYMTVCTPSSHDCSTIRGWWEEDYSKTQVFWNEQLGNFGKCEQFASIEICRRIMDQHFYSPSMWAIFPLQELFALFDDLRVPDPKSEQINQPSNPTHYWRYRMQVSVDHLVSHNALTETFKKLAKESRRDE